VGANHGPLSWQGAAVHGDKFPEDIFPAYIQVSRFALILQVLRLLADAGIGKKSIARTDDRWAGHGYVILQPASIPQRHPFMNHAIWADVDIGPDLGSGVNDGSGMNHAGADKEMNEVSNFQTPKPAPNQP
jgi:hypothetical protein